MSEMISKLIGTVAVILLISAFFGSSDFIQQLFKSKKHWMYSIFAGVVGGVFGIYGNISGIELNGAIISVRDIGPMLAGFIGGPIGGVIAGAIAGLHRLMLGGITAQACVVATCCIGLICGIISKKWHGFMKKPYDALWVAACMEAFHLCIVLIMVKPFETALDIVRQIALPFIAINALGFMIMIGIINYTERHRILALERSRLQSELEVANVIQHSLLPSITTDYPGVKELDVSASMEAAKEVGGDFYDLYYVDPTHLVFSIGDVSGKGVPAALFMASAKTILQNCIRDIHDLPEALETANNSLCARNEAEMFLTLWVGVLDLTDGTLNYVSAGHNPPVWIHNGKPEFLKIKNDFVLAGMEGIRYHEHSVQLSSGDVICLYTDGVVEAEDDAHNLFGEKRLIDCFEGICEGNSADIIAGIKDSVEAFIDGNSQFDDMTMLCVKKN